jgi:hypothetical protein
LKPASPHLNGKVERSQRTDLEAFYATVDLSAEDLADRLIGNRITTSFERTALWTAVQLGKSVRARVTAPLFGEVEALYDESVERIRYPDYRMNLQLAAKQDFGKNRL